MSKGCIAAYFEKVIGINAFIFRIEHVYPPSLIESRERLDIAKVAYGYRFWRDAPPAPNGVPADMSPVAAGEMRKVASVDGGGTVFADGGKPSGAAAPVPAAGLVWDTWRTD